MNRVAFSALVGSCNEPFWVVARGYHCGECCNWRSDETINNSVGTSCFVLDVEVELLQICGPLLKVVILQFSLCLHELQRLVINVDDCLLTENVMPPLAAGLAQWSTFLCLK
jgi:hypothetical protein